jgi:hypothetical protein
MDKELIHTCEVMVTSGVSSSESCGVVESTFIGSARTKTERNSPEGGPVQKTMFV